MIEKTTYSDTETRSAFFSDCEQYRYLLEVTWDKSLPPITVIGLNSSTADHLHADPTTRRVHGFAQSWGYGGFRMLNAFALRSPDPKNLFTHKDPVGPDNTLEFLKSCASELTLAAWGGNIQSVKWPHYYRGHEISDTIPNLHCFKITDKGHPAHPLYLKADLKPIPFSYKE